MLTLDIAGRFLPIPKDFSMQLTWKSPVCNFEKIPNGFSLDFSFPINDFFQALFGNPHRYAKYRAANDQKFPDFHVRDDGALMMAGTLTITDCAGGKYNCSLIDQVGVLGEKEAERSILDISFFAQEQTFVNKTQYTPDDDTYCCFPIFNSGFFKEKGLIVECQRMVTDPNNPAKQIAEKYDTELLTNLFAYTTTAILGELVGGRVNSTVAGGGLINQFASNISLADPANRNPGGFPSASKVSVVSPFFFLNYIIQKSLADHDITIGANYLGSHVALKNLAIYNTFDITKATFTTTSDYITIGESNVKVLGKSISYYVRANPNKIIPKNHLPKLKVGELLLSTQNLFNVCLHFLPNSTVNIYSRDALLTGSSTDLDKYFLESWDIGEKKNVALKFTRKHDDKDLVFSERFKDLSDRRGDLKEKVMDWDDLRFVPGHDGDIRFVSNSGIFAECKWITISEDDPVTKKAGSKDILGWEEASIGFQDGWYEFGREEVEEIKTLWSTPYANFGTLAVEQSGNTSAWPSKSQEFGPRLMFRVPGYGNYGNNAFTGYSISDNNKFYLEYEYISGIFEKFWRYWNPFWANRLPVTGTFDFPVNVLRHLIYNICKKYRTREGEFLIDEMSCTLYIDRISETTIKAFKVD